MPSFPKPKFVFNFDLQTEVQNLIVHKNSREIPEKSMDKLLLGSWNVANLGLQIRQGDHYKLIAEIIGWFDIVAIQEVNDILEGLKAIESELPAEYDLIFSDKGGNNERSAIIYDSTIINQLELVGEVAVPPKWLFRFNLCQSFRSYSATHFGSNRAIFFKILNV